MNTSQSHSVYPPPNDSSDDEDFSSMPDLVTPEEGMSPVTDHSNDSGYETQGSAPVRYCVPKFPHPSATFNIISGFHILASPKVL